MKRSAEEASLHIIDRASTEADPCSISNAPPQHSVSIGSSSSSGVSSSSLHRTSSTATDESILSDNDQAIITRRFINARLLLRDGSLNKGELIVDSSTGIILEVNLDSQQPVQETKYVQAHTVDCRGMILSPGFIDIQLNGAYGIDFSNGGCTDKSDGLSIDDVFKVANSLCQSGVTSFCPTMVSSSRETYKRVIPLMRRARKEQKSGARILGMHLEGPFFDPSKRGAHDERHILAPSKGIATVKDVYGLQTDTSSPKLVDIDIITLAPELDGALDAIDSLTQNSINSNNVVVSCGHTGATYEEGIRAVNKGATLLTHLFNAMNPFHHRNPGLVGLLSSYPKLKNMGLMPPYFSLIVDGIHVHESAVCMAYSCHSKGCVLVTDAMSAMGLGDGTHALGDMSVNIKGDRATLTGTDTLAGSVVTMDTCVRRFKQFTGCSIGEALLCATLHPANVLNRSEVQQREDGFVEPSIGVLETDARANLVIITDELEIVATWVDGQIAYQSGMKLI